MRYSVILVPDDAGTISVSVPALRGCVSVGRSREEALAHAREAIIAWIESESARGAPIPSETPAIVAAGVEESLQIIDEMRAAGELPANHGYELSVVPVDVQPSVAA